MCSPDGPPRAAANVTPYVDGHPLGRIWLLIWIGALLNELATVMPVLRARARSAQPRAARDRGSRFVLLGSVAVTVLLLGYSRRLFPSAAISPPALSFFAGIAILAAGASLRIWAIRTLGAYFSYEVETTPGQPVIRTGPYDVLRHPSYAGLLLIVIGSGLMWGNWVALAGAVAIVLAAIVYRILIEERVLRDELGDSYSDYEATVKRLLPLIW